MKKYSPLKIVIIILVLAFGLNIHRAGAWGFYGHKMLTRMAVFTLPPEMITFFKKHIEYLVNHATDPDKRSHGVKGEAEKHYIDIDHWGDSCFRVVPERWKDAVAKLTEDTLNKYGINPWWVEKMTWKLTQAFKDEDLNLILYYAANISHYIEDATVPLHTSQFYDGKTPEQKGVHALWESRVPELFAEKYNFFVGRAHYVKNFQDEAWQNIKLSHAQMDTVLNAFDYMRLNFPQDKMFVMENKGNVIKEQYSPEYCKEFTRRMNDMEERNMRRAILAVGSIWYSCWVNAGQPDLSRLDNKEIAKKQKEDQDETDRMWRTGKPVGRPNPGEDNDQ